MNSRRPSRRAILQIAAALPLAAPAFAAAPHPRFAVPHGACDCHVHVFHDPARFHFADDRRYTPPIATAAQLAVLHDRLGIERTVVVAPSVYGADMAPTLAAIRTLGLRRARGVSVFSATSTPAELGALHAAGIRGMRINAEMIGATDAEDMRRLFALAIAQAVRQGWHIQIAAPLPLLSASLDLLRTAAVPIVLDHFAGAEAALGLDQPGFAGIVNLVRLGTAYVKLSAPYRVSSLAPDYPDVTPLARALIAANPARMLWGSDWPHPGGAVPADYKPKDTLQPYAVDEGRTLGLLADWAPTTSIRRHILVDNPVRLYGFR